MRLYAFLIFAALGFLSAARAQAQDMNTILDVPVGQTLVNLSATERMEVDQDLLIASLRYEAQNDDAQKLQDDINNVMKKALDKAKAYPDVKIETQQYYVYRHEYDPNPRPMNGTAGKLVSTWRGQQGLMLKSKNGASLLKLLGELQGSGMVVNSLDYTLSPELLEQTQNALLEGALAKLSDKAQRVAKALGKSKADLLNVNVDTGGYAPVPMMARMEMAMDAGAAKMSAPVAAAGRSDITLSVSATAVIKP